MYTNKSGTAVVDAHGQQLARRIKVTSGRLQTKVYSRSPGCWK